MQPISDDRFDVASYQSVGARDYQEDAIALEFQGGADYGLVVLADGMGGHAAGDIAAAIVVEKVLERLTAESDDMVGFFHKATEVLREAANNANNAVGEHVEENPANKGMGATLVSTVILNNMLFWISIGDSPLYLYRGGALSQLNEDHSMAPQIDFLIENGLMDPEVGRNHPDRSCLTSVIAGTAIERIDCPAEPFRLRQGDLLIPSSDGLQYLSNEQIASVLASCEGLPAGDVADALAAAIEDLDDPHQDNASFAVINVCHAGEEEDAYEVAWDFEEAEPAANGEDVDDQPRASFGS